MAESVALSYWPITIVPESKLSHMATVQYGFVPKLCHHGGKTPRFALKNIFRDFSSYRLINGFLCFSYEDVFSCDATGDNGRAIAGACSQAQSHDNSTKARRAKTSAEGFLRFL